MEIMRRNFLGGLAGWLVVPLLPTVDPPKVVEPWAVGPDGLEKWKRAPRTPRLALEGSGLLASGHPSGCPAGRLFAMRRSPVPLPLRFSEPKIASLVSAVENNRTLEFLYHGGSTPGESRRVSPGLVFESEGFPGLYLSGYCHQRRAERVFRVELIELS